MVLDFIDDNPNYEMNIVFAVIDDETKGWARDYFGRVVVANTLVDVVADTRYDFPNYAYEPFERKGII